MGYHDNIFGRTLIGVFLLTCLIAVDRHTGKIVWKTPQPSGTKPLGATSYATPVI
ncbi:MAG: hypothetical protein ISS70_01015 [Phycisphaerae bacterium]|nr:hypothetical protein [Phycisphaerae bacterium]